MGIEMFLLVVHQATNNLLHYYILQSQKHTIIFCPIN